MIQVQYFKSPLDDDLEPSSSFRDLSAHPRIAIRGRKAAEVLARVGLIGPQTINSLLAQENYPVSIMRVGKTEYWIFSHSVLDGDLLALTKMFSELETHVASLRCYVLPLQYSHAHLLLHSLFASDILAKLCAIDLRPDVFKAGELVQTSVARVAAVVASHNFEAAPAMSIFCDSANVSYLWTALTFAEKEFL